MSWLEPPRAKAKFRRIAELCRELRPLLALGAVPLSARERLAEAWEEYLRELPREVAESEGIAILGYPQVVRLADVPRKLREDPLFAHLMIELYSG